MTQEPEIDYALIFKTERDKLGLSRQQLGEALGLKSHRKTIAKIENGTSKPSLLLYTCFKYFLALEQLKKITNKKL
jgi:DNA-binding XRE family transcriptional regulator